MPMQKPPLILTASLLLIALTLCAGCISLYSAPETEILTGTWQDPNGEYTYVYMASGQGYISAANILHPVCVG